MCPLTVSHIVVWNDVKHTVQVNSLSPQSHKWNCRCPFQHLTKIKIGTYLKIDTLWGYLSSPLSYWILLSMALICHSKTCPMYLYIGQRIVELALLGLPWFYRLIITGLGSACWWWSLGHYKIYNCRNLEALGCTAPFLTFVFSVLNFYILICDFVRIFNSLFLGEY